jgi:DNA-binding XRE family transcriptional regulator
MANTRLLTIEQAREIRTSILSDRQLAEKYQVSQTLISNIATGKHYKESDPNFPERRKPMAHRKRRLTMKEAREIRASRLSVKDLANIYCVSETTIWNIGTGKTYKEDGMQLKQMNPGRKRKIYNKDKAKIKELYFNTDMTQTAISKIYGVNPKTISKVISE